MARLIAPLLLILPLLLPFSTLADEPAPGKKDFQQWGDLTGQLIFDGKPPKPARLIAKPGFPPTFDESLVVDEETRGLANVFVYLRGRVGSDELIPVHQEAQRAIREPAVYMFDMAGFKPHVLTVHKDQTLILKHLAGVALNPKGDFYRNVGWSYLIPPGQEVPHQFTKSETIPAPIHCSIHPWFSGYILVRDNPFMTTTDKEGKFTIKNLPVGEFEFQFWQERIGYMQLPTVEFRDAELPGKLERGRLQIMIQPGENDLGEIKLDPKQFGQ